MDAHVSLQQACSALPDVLLPALLCMHQGPMNVRALLYFTRNQAGRMRSLSRGGSSPYAKPHELYIFSLKITYFVLNWS